MTTKSYYEMVFSPKSSFLSSAVRLTCFFLVALLLLPWLCEDSETFQRFIGSCNSAGEYAFFTRSAQTDAPKDGPKYVSKDEPKDGPKDGPMAKLIQDIREAVGVAAAESNVSFSAEDRKMWEENFPCRSRVEIESFYEKRKHVRYVPLNKQWLEVLAEYEVLHRVCMSRVGDLKNYFMSKNESTGCKFIIAEAHYGLGNKILHMSSLFVYAVLIQRVILIPKSTSAPSIMCEPLPGSSWSMSADLHRTVKSHRRTVDQLHAAVDDDVSGNQSMSIYASQGGGDWGPAMRFWCDTEQKLYSKVTWLTFDGCLHSLPKLFAIGKFRPILEEIFPTRIVLTHVLRTVMLPADPAWEQILNATRAHPEKAEKQVGVQVRFHRGVRQYKKDNAPVDEHITRCLLDKGFLPEVCPPETTQANSTVATEGRFVNCSSSQPDANSPSPVTKVFIASLFLGFHDYLEKIYSHRETVDREKIAIVQLTHEKSQGSGVNVDKQALVEVIILSFSDVLLITPYSTFGGLAQAYGALVPYFIDYNATETRVPCQQGLTTEPCCLGAAPSFDCRYDPPQHRDVVDVVPYLQRCMTIDVGRKYAMLMMNENRDDF